MIAFGTAVTDSDVYDRCAAPGIRIAAEPDSVVIAHQTAGSLFHNYNLLLDKAAELDQLEALVLVHQDTELVEADFADRIREPLRDPEVAIVGCAGAVGVRSIAWWQGAVTWASMSHRYTEFGGGEFPAFAWDPETAPSHAAPGEVDSIDGLVMVLSPWAIRNLRFDESLGKLHGYDFDICMQARVAGKKIYAADFRAVHHHSLELVSDPDSWTAAYIRLAEKWSEHLPDTGSSAEDRALRAEAQAACESAITVSNQLRTQAINRQLSDVREELAAKERELAESQRQLQAILGGVSWRVTRPIRAVRRRRQ